MRLFPTLILPLLLVGCVQRRDAVNRQEREPAATNAASVATVEQDSAVQQYEMITYYMAFLRKGPQWTETPTPEVMAIHNAHMAYLNKLADSGSIVLAGPYVGQTGENALAGMFLFKTETEQEARKLADADPSVIAGRFTMEIVPWLGPSTLRY